MKKYLFLFSLIVWQLNAQDQTINGTTFKQDGKVGIGTTSPNHELTVEGTSSPNIELKNSNYSNGGFVINRTNYGHQWKWWAQSNVMYFDFSTDETNYSNKFTIKSSGNVGIGASNPLEKLHIGNTFTFHDGGHKVLGIMYGPSGGVDLSATQYAAELRFDPNSGILGLGTSSSVTNNPTSHLFINKNGYVGIGTSSPNEKLTVRGYVNIGGDGNYRLRTRHVDGKHYSNTSVDNLYLNYNTGKNVFVGFGGQNSDLYVDGNVGIGTANTQGFKLGVDGDVAALEVKIATYANWPDYVFKHTYHLPALKDVAQHIKDNGHLKDIPSAKKVKKDGFYLAEMNAKLLQKIEELTLYTIEQEKKLEAQSADIEKLNSLQEENKQLHEKFDALKAMVSQIIKNTKN